MIHIPNHQMISMRSDQHSHSRLRLSFWDYVTCILNKEDRINIVLFCIYHYLLEIDSILGSNEDIQHQRYPAPLLTVSKERTYIISFEPLSERLISKSIHELGMKSMEIYVIRTLWHQTLKQFLFSFFCIPIKTSLIQGPSMQIVALLLLIPDDLLTSV